MLIRKTVAITNGTSIDSTRISMRTVVFNAANPPTVTHNIPATALLMPVSSALTNKERDILLASKSLAFWIVAVTSLASLPLMPNL